MCAYSNNKPTKKKSKKKNQANIKDQSDHRFSGSTSIGFFQLFTPCHQPAELDFCCFSSVPLPHSDQSQCDTTAVRIPPASLPSDHDDLTASLLSTPLCPPHRQLLHIPLSSPSAENTLLVCLFNARSIGTSRRKSDISTFTRDNNIDIMLLTETWLHPAGDKAKIADLASPGYSVLSFPCSALHGGLVQKAGGHCLHHKGLS